MVYKCSVCGNEFEVGAVIRGIRIHCPECEDEYQEFVNDVAFQSLKKPGQEIDEIDRLVDQNLDRIQKFKMPISSIKMEAVGVMMRVKQGLR
jgi:CRISPR/Cas system-associated protein Cas10 (large subunit of type III CRISPR-Cas system)